MAIVQGRQQCQLSFVAFVNVQVGYIDIPLRHDEDEVKVYKFKVIFKVENDFMKFKERTLVCGTHIFVQSHNLRPRSNKRSRNLQSLSLTTRDPRCVLPNSRIISLRQPLSPLSEYPHPKWHRRK